MILVLLVVAGCHVCRIDLHVVSDYLLRSVLLPLLDVAQLVFGLIGVGRDLPLLLDVILLLQLLLPCFHLFVFFIKSLMDVGTTFG